MPYFNNNIKPVLFIHIPKTGGTSIEQYFSKKYSIPLDYRSLYDFIPIDININMDKRISLQHKTYNEIIKYKDIFNINLDNLTITIVRNPYTRIISDLFYFNLITIDNTKEEVYKIIIKYTNTTNKYDNHNIPQYHFILDNTYKINNNIHIMKTETLTEDMHKLGYTDFNLHENINKHSNLNYYDYLNNNSIKHINNIYANDFKYFKYDNK